jgi:hypothetical protein
MIEDLERGAVAAGVTGSVCGARLHRGGRCALPPSPGKQRCFQHGGARGIGAPKGNDNARKDGFYSRPEIAERRRINDFIRECNALLQRLDEQMKAEPDWESYRATRRLRP